MHPINFKIIELQMNFNLNQQMQYKYRLFPRFEQQICTIRLIVINVLVYCACTEC